MKQTLEQYQVGVYLVMILAGIGVGTVWPTLSDLFEVLLWPVLAVLLYATFTQVPLLHIRTAFKDKRFLSALIIGNFLLMPVIVWLLSRLLPADQAVMLGFFLVLLVPCTDWFISFTHLGGGDTARAVVTSPVLLLLQIGLLPIYLHLFMGDQLVGMQVLPHLLPAFFILIVIPLLLAWLTEKLARNRPTLQPRLAFLGWLPVPALGVTVFLIAASQVQTVFDAGNLLGWLAVMFMLYLVAAALLGRLLGQVFKLPAASTRTLIFSLGTRNSFVMLPLAIALPELWAAAVVVIVFQSLVELFGMLVFLKWLPRCVADSPHN